MISHDLEESHYYLLRCYIAQVVLSNAHKALILMSFLYNLAYWRILWGCGGNTASFRLMAALCIKLSSHVQSGDTGS